MARELRSARPELTPLELDRIKRESRARADGKPRFHVQREKKIIMKTRATILAVLVSGIVLSGTGAALGLSGIGAGDDSAGQIQYPSATVPCTEQDSGQSGAQNGTTGTNGSDEACGHGSEGVSGNHGSSGGPTVLGETTTKAPSGANQPVVAGTQASGTAPAAAAQPTRQVALESNGSLPFTGYAAIPVLLLGLALIGTGVVMRRRTAQDES